MTVTEKHALRVRTITFGASLSDLQQLDGIERCIAALKRARERFNAEGYEVQTLRVALAPLIAGMSPTARDAALLPLKRIDALLIEHGVIMSLGPIAGSEAEDLSLAEWTTNLVRETRSISFSVVVASPEGGVLQHGAQASAQIMLALAHALPGGLANFRFAAAANIPAGTPFFPVAWHTGPDSLAVGLEAASLVEEAWAGKPEPNRAESELKRTFQGALQPIEAIANQMATSESRAYLGIDSSTAPGMDRSIGAGIERLLGVPFGSASTLNACATLTAAIKSISVKLCGYSGLMLPVLEDPILAQRASEGRFTVRDLLLYSSVCGTGLDVVPVPASTSEETLTGLITDVAALSMRLRKPLSVRLLLVPGKEAGELATFDSPLLTSCKVMKID
jgi:uncharacterized protein (UPF0210 family)